MIYVYTIRFLAECFVLGSHDINCNRDLRDALGALGPVDGISPELGNLTIAITTVQKGDIVMVASDGLTDNLDPNVCRFTVNNLDTTKLGFEKINSPQKQIINEQRITENKIPSRKNAGLKPPIKPPRRTKKVGDGVDRNEKNSNLPETKLTPETRPFNVSSGETMKVREEEKERKLVDCSQKLQDVCETTTVKSDKRCLDETHPLVAHFMRENSLDETPKNSTGKLIITTTSLIIL